MYIHTFFLCFRLKHMGCAGQAEPVFTRLVSGASLDALLALDRQVLVQSHGALSLDQNAISVVKHSSYFI